MDTSGQPPSKRRRNDCAGNFTAVAGLIDGESWTRKEPGFRRKPVRQAPPPPPPRDKAFSPPPAPHPSPEPLSTSDSESEPELPPGDDDDVSICGSTSESGDYVMSYEEDSSSASSDSGSDDSDSGSDDDSDSGSDDSDSGSNDVFDSYPNGVDIRQPLADVGDSRPFFLARGKTVVCRLQLDAGPSPAIVEVCLVRPNGHLSPDRVMGMRGRAKSSWTGILAARESGLHCVSLDVTRSDTAPVEGVIRVDVR